MYINIVAKCVLLALFQPNISYAGLCLMPLVTYAQNNNYGCIMFSRHQPIMLIFHLLCYAAVLKFLTYYAQYYAHVKELCLKSDCSIRVYSLVSHMLSLLLEYIKFYIEIISMVSVLLHFIVIFNQTLPIMLALCLMLLGTYHAQNYASIISGCLMFKLLIRNQLL